MNDDSNYSVEFEQCDVIDRARLSKFRTKRMEWVFLLEKDKLHSVSTQLSSLFWQDAVFRLFNESMRLGDSKRPTASMNRLLWQSLSQGYVNGVVLGVSRLTDKSKANKKGDQGVVSLRRVFDDICEHRALITREIFVCYNGRVYDPHSIPPPSARSFMSSGSIGLSIGGLDDFMTPMRLHEHFDRLSGKSAHCRSRDDTIQDEIFENIDTLLASPPIEKIRKLRNKVIAHAADEASRTAADLENYGFTLAEAEQALQALAQAQHGVQIDLLWNTDNTVMPIPQFDIAEYLELPFMDKSQKAALGPFWAQLTDERRRWRDVGNQN